MADQEKAVKPPLIREEVIPESLRLHSTIPTQTAAKMARYQKFQSKNAVSRTGAISFDILTGDQNYMDISSAVLHIECQIGDGKSAVISLKGDAPEGGGAAPFDFETRLLNTKDVKEGSLQLMGFNEEVVPLEDVSNLPAYFPWEEVADGTTEPDALANAALNR